MRLDKYLKVSASSSGAPLQTRPAMLGAFFMNGTAAKASVQVKRRYH